MRRFMVTEMRRKFKKFKLINILPRVTAFLASKKVNNRYWSAVLLMTTRHQGNARCSGSSQNGVRGCLGIRKTNYRLKLNLRMMEKWKKRLKKTSSISKSSSSSSSSGSSSGSESEDGQQIKEPATEISSRKEPTYDF